MESSQRVMRGLDPRIQARCAVMPDGRDNPAAVRFKSSDAPDYAGTRSDFAIHPRAIIDQSDPLAVLAVIGWMAVFELSDRR